MLKLYKEPGLKFSPPQLKLYEGARAGVTRQQQVAASEIRALLSKKAQRVHHARTQK